MTNRPYSPADFLANYLAPTGTRQLTKKSTGELAEIFDFEKNLTKLRETNVT